MSEKRKQLNISVDYDNTYTADKDCFKAVIRCFQSLGHKVYIVTMRSKELDYHEDFDILKNRYDVETIFCDGNPKRKFCEDKGVCIDIWMDDFPEGICLGTQYSPEELNQWRKEQTKIPDEIGV